MTRANTYRQYIRTQQNRKNRKAAREDLRAGRFDEVRATQVPRGVKWLAS